MDITAFPWGVESSQCQLLTSPQPLSPSFFQPTNWDHLWYQCSVEKHSEGKAHGRSNTSREGCSAHSCAPLCCWNKTPPSFDVIGAFSVYTHGNAATLSSLGLAMASSYFAVFPESLQDSSIPMLSLSSFHVRIYGLWYYMCNPLLSLWYMKKLLFLSRGCGLLWVQLRWLSQVADWQGAPTFRCLHCSSSHWIGKERGGMAWGGKVEYSRVVG